MNINIKDIRKNAAKIAVSYLVVFFYISGVLIIITLIIMGGYMHINLLKNLWPIRLLAIDVIGAFIVIPIVYLIAMHSKKLQIRYIKEVIESKYTYAKALRSYSDEFSKKVFALADEKISEITKLSSTAIDYDQEQWKTVEDYVKKKLEASWKKVKKMIDETSDQDTKNELYESFIEHKAEMLEHLKVSKSLYDSKKIQYH